MEKPPPSGPKLDPDLALPRMYHLRINAINLGFPPKKDPVWTDHSHKQDTSKLFHEVRLQNTCMTLLLILDKT